MQSTKRYSLRFNNLQQARRLHDEIVPLFPGILITIGEESGAQYLLCAWIPDLTRPMLSDRLAERGVEINVDEGLSWEDYDREIEEDDEDNVRQIHV